MGRGGKWEKGTGGRGHVYIYDQFMLLYGKKQSQYCKVIKGRGTRDQIANICWIIEKAREF